jgi:hypothetical protein
MSITDTQVSRHVLPAACRLIGAVRAGDQLEVSRVLGCLQVDLRTDATTAVQALAVVLAAACPDDQPMGELLAWRTPEYQRLRQAGVPADTAAVLAARNCTMKEVNSRKGART